MAAINKECRDITANHAVHFMFDLTLLQSDIAHILYTIRFLDTVSLLKLLIQLSCHSYLRNLGESYLLKFFKIPYLFAQRTLVPTSLCETLYIRRGDDIAQARMLIGQKRYTAIGWTYLALIGHTN